MVVGFRLRFTVHYYTHTHILASTVTSSLPLLGNGYQQKTFRFVWVPEVSPASSSNSSQRLDGSSPLTNSIHSPLRHGPLRRHLSFVSVQFLLSCLLEFPRDPYSDIA
jgi:hypothetical protein